MEARWIEWDGKSYRWRTVDNERYDEHVFGRGSTFVLMKIAVDISTMAEFRTGTEEYVEGLAAGLSRLGTSVVGVGRQGQPLLPDKPMLGLTPIARASLWRKWWWESYGVRRIIPGVDLLHIPYLSHPPERLAIPTVVTVHDLIPFRMTNYRARWRERTYFSQLKRRLPFASALVAISEATFHDVEDFFPGLADRVVTIPNGVHPDFFETVDTSLAEGVRSRLGLKRHPRILYVGGYDARKNVPTLMKAAAKVFERLPDGELVLVGAKGRPDVRELAEELHVSSRLVVTPYVSRRELVALYQSADLFVYPSRYEGFGLPPAQALAMGLPVIAGDTAAVSEVLKDSGILVDPESVDDWASAITKVLEGPALAQRMAARGRARAEDFSWDRVAQQYVKLYERVVQERRITG